MTEESKRWLQAITILGEDPSKAVLCPKCNIGYLKMKDVPWENGQKCDRHFICPNCNAYNTVTFLID